MVKTLNIKLSDIGQDIYLRNDEKFYTFFKDSNWNVFNCNNKELIPLKEIIYENAKIFNYEEGEDYLGIPTGSSYIDEYGTLLDNQIVTKEDHPGRLKYKVTKDNILLSSLRLAKAPALNFTKENLEKYVFSNGFYIFNIKNNWNIRFVMYLLRMPQIKNVLDNNIYRGIGISSFKIEDLYKILVPNISIEAQKEFCKKVELIEHEISEIKKNIKPHAEVINDVFSKYFNYDNSLLNKIEKGMTFATQKCKEKKWSYINLNASNISDENYNLRCSFRSKNFTLNQIKNMLKKYNTLKIKDVCTEIIKGVQPQYAEDGIPVIKISNLKSEYIDNDFTEFADTIYCQNIESNKFVRENDIIICSIGKGSLGKADIVEETIDAIPSVDNYILRIDEEKYNPRFLVYFLRSIFGIAHFELNYSGATNQIHIYDKDILRFEIPDIPKEDQSRLVNEIKQAVLIQNKHKDNIKFKSNKIVDLMNDLLCN